jgi:hypothetical protein
MCQVHCDKMFVIVTDYVCIASIDDLVTRERKNQTGIYHDGDEIKQNTFPSGV